MSDPIDSVPHLDSLAAAVLHLRAGNLVAFPTETVYGVGVDATNDTAVASIFSAKGRPTVNPLIVHTFNVDAAKKIAQFDDRALSLARTHWPGPLTLVLRRTPDCKVVPRVSAGLDTIAVRVPAHELALQLLHDYQTPIAAPSANPSGQISPTTADHVMKGLGNAVSMTLDGGPCRIGIESTVISLIDETPVLLRPGAITVEDLRSVIGQIAALPSNKPNASELLAPGMLDRHYAPSCPLRLDAVSVAKNEALLSFGSHILSGAAMERNLSPAADIDEAAKNLFRMLHELDRPTFRAIAVMPIPWHGRGTAINDRLRRGASTL